MQYVCHSRSIHTCITVCRLWHFLASDSSNQNFTAIKEVCCIITDTNPSHNTSYTQQPITHKTFAETTANISFPKKEQAIIFNTIQDVPQIEYVKAFSQLTSPNNIKFASRISNNRFCIYFSSKNIVDQVITKQPYIIINHTEIS